LPEDVKEVVNDVMRHRLILTYKATVKGLSPEDILKAILEEIRVD
jgi:MoxR-like ATPase